MILFNTFLNNVLDVLNNSDIYNFAGNNTISVASKNRDKLLEALKNESKSAVNWFRNNNMSVNPEKFRLMLIQKSITTTMKLNLRTG